MAQTEMYDAANDDGKKSSLAKSINRNISDSQKAQKAWRQAARTAYQFYAGDQWTEREKADLKEDERPAITFNRTVRVVNAVTGLEVQNRQTIAYSQREEGDAIKSEILTGAVNWVRDLCDAEDEESQAFKDCVICGLGFTDTYLNYELDPDGEIIEDRVDPLEMGWDPSSKKRNLDDAKFMWRARQYTIKEVKEIWPDADVSAVGDNVVPMDTPGEPIDRQEARFYRSDSPGVNYDRNKITVYQYQWYEKEIYYRVQENGEIISLTEKEFKRIKPLIEENGLLYVKQSKRRYKQAFLLGPTILEKGDLPINRFTFRAITGLCDHMENLWFGLLHLMHDPQKYANKWLSQVLYILNTNPSGGYFYEKGAISNINRFKDDLSHPAKNIELIPGGLAKLKPKDTVSFPVGIDKLMNYAIESINDLVGVNLEMLGVANRNQAGVLEAQRKEAGITILADFFDSLRRFRKEQGRVLADFVIEYISDGRLIKIEGDELGKYVPIFRQDLDFKYDIVIDDTPASPSSREKTFELLMAILPQLMEAGLPIPPEILDYAPLPADLVMKWKQMLNQPPPEPSEIEKFSEEIKKKLAVQQVQQNEIDMAKDEADIKKKQADVTKTYADTELDLARAQREQALATKDVIDYQSDLMRGTQDLIKQSFGGF
jgi:hypothetical protein